MRPSRMPWSASGRPAQDVLPASKRQRTSPHEIMVPRDITSVIQSALGSSPPLDQRILTWNIDGLDNTGDAHGVMLRTLAAAQVIARLRPSAILLQEVIPPALALISAPQVLGSAYEVVEPDIRITSYGVAILIDKKKLRRVGNPITVAFPSSVMDRHLLVVFVEFVMPRQDCEQCDHEFALQGRVLALATAHLESTQRYSFERSRQLQQCFRYLSSLVGQIPPGNTSTACLVGSVVFGGDLNLRDPEAIDVRKQLGGDFCGFQDVWEVCGCPEESRWTWDSTTNTNIKSGFICRARFDRVFYLAACSKDGISNAVASNYMELKPTAVKLVGNCRAFDLGRFPSDHWGVLTSWVAGK